MSDSFTTPGTVVPLSSKNIGAGCHFLLQDWAFLVNNGSVIKNLPDNAGDTRDAVSNPGSGRSPGEGNSGPLQYSCLGILWTEDPGGLQSMGLQRVGQDSVTKQQQNQCLSMCSVS